MSRTRQALITLSVGCCAVLAALTVPTTSGALTGSIRNQNNAASTGIFNGPCTTTSTGTGSATFVWPLDESTGAATARDISGNSRTGTYRNTGQITYGTAGPCPRDSARAVTLSGAANGGFVSTTTTTAITGPTVFSAAVWFKTTSTAGGKLMGFGNLATGASSNYDRHLYLTNAGNVVAGVYPNAAKTIQSPATYRNNAWHLAVITLAPSGNEAGLRLYVDGALVGSDTTVTTAQVFDGFWRVGYDNLNGWPNTPTSPYFAGSLAYASVHSTALTPTQVTALYNAGI